MSMAGALAWRAARVCAARGSGFNRRFSIRFLQDVANSDPAEMIYK
jgi:hypothetical protein